jgi:hypothetical protein
MTDFIGDSIDPASVSWFTRVVWPPSGWNYVEVTKGDPEFPHSEDMLQVVGYAIILTLIRLALDHLVLIPWAYRALPRSVVEYSRNAKYVKTVRTVYVFCCLSSLFMYLLCLVM